MRINQISVFLENKKGRLREITGILADYKIDIRALSIAETKDFGVLRMIVNKPEKAYETLKSNGFTVRETPVFAIEVEDKPGGLHGLLKLLDSNDINVEYMYAFVEKETDKALMVMRFDNLEKAEKILKENKISFLPAEKIYGA